MPEDQSVNGDRWTEHASLLLKRLGWQKIADSNIDIEGSDGLKHGIDALFRYEDGHSTTDQGVFLEAKRYQTSSFREEKIQDWISVLDQKIHDLRHSEEFNWRYPAMTDTNPQNGILMLWFHDHINYHQFFPKLNAALLAAKPPQGRKARTNRLFVLSNYDILRLASLASTFEQWANDNELVRELKYFYPSRIEQNLPFRELPVLSLEYMFSRFVIAKAVKQSSTGPENILVVCYFGELDYPSFAMLKKALLLHNLLPGEQSHLYLYHYKRDDEFRKIEPDVKALFQVGSTSKITLKPMEIYGDLPPSMYPEANGA